MWTPTIARELRKRDLDVIAISEPAHASRYTGISGDEVFARAQDDGYTIVSRAATRARSPSSRGTTPRRATSGDSNTRSSFILFTSHYVSGAAWLPSLAATFVK
jgi:hypothetical protein